jgi:hypothetical protein
MSTTPSPLAQITQLKAQIEKLKEEAVKELRLKKEALVQEITSIDAQLAELTVEESGAAPKRKEKPAGKSIPLQDLKALLADAPDKTISIRREGLDLRNIRVLAEANPGLLKLGGKGPWPTVTLLK